MKIEFEKIENNLIILESLIRDYPAADESEEYAETHFQARLKSNEVNEYDSIVCSFAYYSKENVFLGLDSDSIWVGEISLKNPYSISFQITPPVDTVLVKCQIGIRKNKKSIWGYAWPSFTILIFALLISAIINLWL